MMLKCETTIWRWPPDEAHYVGLIVGGRVILARSSDQTLARRARTLLVFNAEKSVGGLT